MYGPAGATSMVYSIISFFIKMQIGLTFLLPSLCLSILSFKKLGNTNTH